MLESTRWCIDYKIRHLADTSPCVYAYTWTAYQRSWEWKEACMHISVCPPHVGSPSWLLQPASCWRHLEFGWALTGSRTLGLGVRCLHCLGLFPGSPSPPLVRYHVEVYLETNLSNCSFPHQELGNPCTYHQGELSCVACCAEPWWQHWALNIPWCMVLRLAPYKYIIC